MGSGKNKAVGPKPSNAVAKVEQEGHENEIVDTVALDSDMEEFEDQFEDEFETENEDFSDDEEEAMEQDSENAENLDARTGVKGMARDASDASSLKVYLPGQPLEEGEELQVDTSVYSMLHSINVKWPTLSFDILRDRLGNDRSTFPHTTYLVTGSQADRAGSNEVTLMKFSRLGLANKSAEKDAEESSDSDSDSDDEEDDVARSGNKRTIESRSFPFYGSVNRIRTMRTSTADRQIVSVWSDAGRRVEIYNVTELFNSLDTPGNEVQHKLRPVHTVAGHRNEGFAMDWSSIVEGNLLTGDCSHQIRVTAATPNGFEAAGAFKGHEGSVEDLQWSPTEAAVFASCSTDGTVRLFDTRAGATAGITKRVASCDVNVISWNRLTPFLLASGHDDGEFCVWDLRMFARDRNSRSAGNAAAKFHWHREAITSIEWHSHEESMLAVAGADNQITLWDLSTEKDEEDDSPVDTAGAAVPAQLLFVHQGQEHIKELHWHSQIQGCVISTAATGLNIFKTINS